MELKTECLPAGVLGFKACKFKAKEWDPTKYRKETKMMRSGLGFMLAVRKP